MHFTMLPNWYKLRVATKKRETKSNNKEHLETSVIKSKIWHPNQASLSLLCLIIWPGIPIWKAFIKILNNRRLPAEACKYISDFGISSYPLRLLTNYAILPFHIKSCSPFSGDLSKVKIDFKIDFSVSFTGPLRNLTKTFNFKDERWKFRRFDYLFFWAIHPMPKEKGIKISFLLKMLLTKI